MLILDCIGLDWIGGWAIWENWVHRAWFLSYGIFCLELTSWNSTWMSLTEVLNVGLKLACFTWLILADSQDTTWSMLPPPLKLRCYIAIYMCILCVVLYACVMKCHAFIMKMLLFRSSDISSSVILLLCSEWIATTGQDCRCEKLDAVV